MFIKKRNQRISHKNSSICVAYEYPFDDKSINISLVKINGRYPETGQVTNTKVKEIIFVKSGKGKIVINKKAIKLEKEDVILLLPNEKYYFEGKFEFITSCSPAWFEGQHKFVK